ncbi:putative PhaE: poly(3-hydroxyalkanoate) synthase component [Desulfosarcina cetonica]|uniref:poly(R)-hydroxyalkanoic acid synthase subunit PhaE n=1 Tax=Desulfosarcina cetonica TaxID=90730 RepID=UPI0006CF9FEE|nr:poly(R)-hydroxyalkanoic acid synthase subunit PhaE [Desulfosarcina cetonica]VTR69169.1 putative PhaE: poly(3-hydroxyalkanoate) synthase component [Desulfosarcina cetonica]
MMDKTEETVDINAMLNMGLKFYGDLWGRMTDQWATFLGQGQTEKKTANGTFPKAQGAMNAALKNWQTLATAMAAPESVSSLLKGSGAMPDVLIKMAQTSVGSFLELQQSLFQRLGRVGESVKAYEFQDMEENIFRLWTDIYEKEFRQFFNVPQLGLLREYQEKTYQTMDKFNLFQANLAEFVRMLGLPFNHSSQVMQDKLTRLAENGELSEDVQAYYRMWIKVLEGHYMTLFQTPEYVEVLARTVNSLSDFHAARDAVFEDMLYLLPVARKTDMDDISRDLYELKKRLRKLEKESRHS